MFVKENKKSVTLTEYLAEEGLWDIYTIINKPSATKGVKLKGIISVMFLRKERRRITNRFNINFPSVKHLRAYGEQLVRYAKKLETIE